MTDAFVLDQPYGQPSLPGSPLRRLLTAARCWRQSFAGDLLRARRDHAIRRDLRTLDRRLLRDLGLDRSAC